MLLDQPMEDTMAQRTEQEMADWKAYVEELQAEYWNDDSKVIFVHGNDVQVEAHRYTRTHEQAVAFKAQFPKSYNVKAGRLGHASGLPQSGTNACSATLLPRKGNASNESGVKRFKAFLRKAEALGYEVRWSQWTSGNAVNMHSEADLDNFVSPWAK